MTKKLLFAIFIQALSISNAFAQTSVDNLKHDATVLATAVLNSDFKTVVTYTHPEIVKQIGGLDKMVSAMEKGMADMKSKGAKIKDVFIGEPGEIFTEGAELYSVIPEKIIMESNGTKFYTISSLIAMSRNNGENWHFIDAGNMTTGQLEYFFPKVHNKLIIPKATLPIVIKE